ncbi:MAG: hypothetical protein V1816_03575 [Pseudomonadota bacterium]
MRIPLVSTVKKVEKNRDFSEQDSRGRDPSPREAPAARGRGPGRRRTAGRPDEGFDLKGLVVNVVV